MATATERWTEREFWEEQQGGTSIWRATIAYDVVDAATERDASNASGMPAMGSDHPVYGAELTLNVRNPRKRGFNYWVVTDTYSSDSGGNLSGNIPTVRWGHDLVIEEVDRDIAGKAITNSVGDPPESPLTNEFYDLTLTYRRKVPEFDIQRSLKFLGAINNDQFSMSKAEGFSMRQLSVYPGECKCVGFAPAGDYQAGGDNSLATPTDIIYEFRIRPRIIVGNGKWASGFDWRILDQGYRGYWTEVTGSGDTRQVKYHLSDFYLRSGERASSPVKLDGHGLPQPEAKVKTIKVKKYTEDAVEPPNAIDVDLDERYSSQGAVFLIYPRCRRENFKGLIPFFK